MKTRKMLILQFLCFVMFISLYPISFGGQTIWDIESGFYFYGSSSGGSISFNEDVTTSQLRIYDGIVEFTSFTMGGNYLSRVGFNCSSNADINVIYVDMEVVTYDVTANSGQTSVTHVKGPENRDINAVSGASSWSYDASSDVVTVNVVHSSDQRVTVYLNPVAYSFRTTSVNLANILLIMIVVFSLALLNDASAGGEMASSFKIIGWVISFTLIFLILNWAENLMN